jgi:predicted PhzF superfamily epimerase YddE/YHI9
MTELHILRVFCDDDGSGGNPLGVFLDGAAVPEEKRRGIAVDLDYAETVFVDDAERAELRIFTPREEIPFAGHPLVGAAWLLRRERGEVSMLRPPAGEVPVRTEAELTFVAGRPEWSLPFEFVQVETPEEVEALDGPPEGKDLVGVWAWLEEEGAIIRERVFLPRYGVDEDEATGSAAMMLCSQLARPINIRQGKGSRILARPLDNGMVEIGGRVELDEVREYGA